jgi:galactokinase
VRAVAPGRVNLIGDHTDYTGGLVLPMAIDRATVVEGEPGGATVTLTSATEPEAATVALDVADARTVEPAWARYVAGVVTVVRPTTGFVGRVSTSIPVGAGLSSSAALEVAVALALGHDPDPLPLALACQRAEHLASGVPCGVMDQLTSAAAQEGHALLIDCSSLAVEPVPVPPSVEVVVVDSGERRRLAESAYGERRRRCEAAAALIGPLNRADATAVAGIADPAVRAAARHVVGENERVRLFAAALSAGTLDECGRLMLESHASLRDDLEVSTPGLDALVEDLGAIPGVYGARLTGAGFGGCVVALAQPGALGRGWRVRPAAGARVEG